MFNGQYLLGFRKNLCYWKENPDQIRQKLVDTSQLDSLSSRVTTTFYEKNPVICIKTKCIISLSFMEFCDKLYFWARHQFAYFGHPCKVVYRNSGYLKKISHEVSVGGACLFTVREFDAFLVTLDAVIIIILLILNIIIVIIIVITNDYKLH